MKKRILGAAVVLTGALFSAPVFADGGYYTGALGARAAGRGGAFVARADDVTAISVNPAGLANLRGWRLEIGNQVSYNGYSFTRAPTLDWGNAQNNMAPTVTFAKVSNGTPAQVADPFIGLATDFGLQDWGFGLAVFAPPGVAQEQFPTTGGQNYMMVHREAIILDVAASAAWKYRDLFGLGLTVEWLPVPRLDYSLVINGNPFAGEANPVSSPLDLLADTKGADWSTFNARLGAWVRPVPWLELGAAGQVIPTSFVTHSTLTATLIAPGIDASQRNVLLTRNQSQASDVTITLPLPMMVRGGARYIGLDGAGVERFDVEADVEYETWSRANAFTLETNGLVATAMGQNVPIGRIIVPKHWQNTVSVKLGGDVALVPDRWTVRGGVYYESPVAPAAYANVDFPGGPQLGAALGGSFLSDAGWELALTYQLRYQPSVSVSEADARVYQQVPASSCAAPYTDPNTCNSHYLGQPAPAINAGTYAAASHLVSLAFLYRFGATSTHQESQP